MKVGDIMAQGAATIRFDAELREAAKLMVARGLRGLPVVNETGCLVGMLSQRDLLRRRELGTEQRKAGRLAS
jgi:CBS-domain-containing membrane protein